MTQATDDPRLHDDIRDCSGTRIQATDDPLAGACRTAELAARFEVSSQRAHLDLVDFRPTPSAPPVANGAACG